MKKWFFFIIIVLFLLIFRRCLLPLGIGLIIAYILDPYVDWLQRKIKTKRSICIFFAYLTFFFIIVVLIFGFTAIVSGNLKKESVIELLKVLETYYQQHQELFTGKLSSSLEFSNMTKVVQSIGRGVLQGLVGCIIGVYLLKDKSYFLRMGSKIMHLFLDQKAHGFIREICFEINEVISSFLKGVLIDSVIVAFLASLSLTLLHVDFAIFIGIFAGISNVIPYFGPVIGMIPAIITAFANDGIFKAFAAAIALFLIQQIECNLIYPRIIGKSTGLHPLFVLITVSIAGFYGGLFSMVLAVPIAGIFRVLFCKWAYAQ